jgi:hypothetical protein
MREAGFLWRLLCWWLFSGLQPLDATSPGNDCIGASSFSLAIAATCRSAVSQKSCILPSIVISSS